jgi:hypothetical protein
LYCFLSPHFIKICPNIKRWFWSVKIHLNIIAIHLWLIFYALY